MNDIETPIRDGHFWLFPDGTRLPVISGGSGDEGAGEGGEPPSGDSGQEPPAGSDAGGDDGNEPDPFDDESVETFSRSYVERLRQKEARYREERNQLRERLAPVEPLFEFFGDDAPSVFANEGRALADLFSTNQELVKNAANYLGNLAAKRAGAKREFNALFEDIQSDIDDAEEGLERELTPEEIQRIVDEKLAERERTAQEQATKEVEQATLRKIDEVLTQRGYGPQDGRPNIEAMQILARAAQRGTVGDTPEERAQAVAAEIDAYEKERDEYLTAIREEAVQAYINDRRQDASNNPRVPSDGAPAGDAPKDPLKMTREERIAWRKARESQASL